MKRFFQLCLLMDTDSESQDFYQDVARSAFADMILDEDRNIRYRDALRFVIEEKHRRGEPANVVDIGRNYFLFFMFVK